MLYKSKGKPMAFNFEEKYGLLQPETWQSEFKHAFNEFMRVLQPEEELIMKWNNNHVADKRMLATLPMKPKYVCCQIPASRGVRRKGTDEPRSVTSFFFFLKPCDALLADIDQTGAIHPTAEAYLC
jgi:hypothetical protein